MKYQIISKVQRTFDFKYELLSAEATHAWCPLLQTLVVRPGYTPFNNWYSALVTKSLHGSVIYTQHESHAAYQISSLSLEPH